MKPSEVANALTICIDAQQPVIVWGEPGIGKSQVGQQTTAALGRKLIDVRASLLDPVDLRGIPHVVHPTGKGFENGRTHWAAPNFLPGPNDGPTVIMLDELNRAPVMTQNALFQLVLDRALGEYRLPDDCSIIACCNRESDGGGVQRMPQALANRFVHLNMEPDLNDLCRYAVKANWEPAVIAFLRFRPELLHKFSRTDRAFPTPRAWEFVSRITAKKPGNGIEHALYAGAVGDAAAGEYSGFLRMFREIPSIDAILLDPMKAPVPTGASTLFAVSAALARRSEPKNFGRVITYLNRLPGEYSVFGVQDAVRRDQKLQHTPEFTKWAVAHSDVTF